MHLRTVKIFDDFVRATGDLVFPADEWSEELGRHHAIALLAVVEDAVPIGSTGTFDLYVAESADNKNWWLRFWNVAAPGSTTAGYGDICVPSVVPGSTYAGMFTDGCNALTLVGSQNTGPSLPYLRFSMLMTSTTPGGTPAFLGAGVKVYATFRGKR